MGTYKTFCDVQGEEFDVVVDADYCAAEPDVNAPAGWEINEVKAKGVDVMHLMSEDELDGLSMRIAESGADDEDAWGDYLYDQKKDRELDERS